MQEHILRSFVDSRRSVHVTVTVADRVIVADMPGVLAGAILKAVLSRPGAIAQPLRGAALTVTSPWLSHALPATKTEMTMTCDRSPESSAYLQALTLSRGEPVLSALAMTSGAPWASLPDRDVVLVEPPKAFVRRARYAAARRADPGRVKRETAARSARRRNQRLALPYPGSPGEA